MPSVLSRLADRTVLCPSTDPIDPDGKTRHLIPFDGGNLEAWGMRLNQHVASPKLITIKFPGTGGRAERAGPHPCELWDDIAAELWTINPAGYGGSDGMATLATMPAQAEAVIAEVQTQFPDSKILLTGNSLGCTSALYLAARHPVAGIFLRNPPPLRQLISQRAKYNWWNLWTARFVADAIPAALDSVENAKRCRCPALFVRCEKDRVVPTRFQKLIIENYGGPLQEYVIPNADHHEFISEDDQERYVTAMTMFKTRLMESCAPKRNGI